MRTFETTNIVSPVKAPFTKRSLDHLNNMVSEPIVALAKSNIGEYTTGNIVHLDGCLVTANIPGTSSITAGSVYYNGEVFLVDANASLITTGSQTLVWVIDEQADQATFSNNTDYDFHITRKMKLQAGASGSGLANYDNDTIVRKVIKHKTINIGAWDMDATAAVLVNHGLGSSPYRNIKSVSIMILADGGGESYPLEIANIDGTGALNSPEISGKFFISGSLVNLWRTTGGFFDNTDFNDSVQNRGYITIQYEDEYVS